MKYPSISVIAGVVVATTSLVLLPGTASAQQWYLSGSAGGGFLTDSELSEPSGVLAALGAEASFDFGFNGALAAGYKFGGPFRLELEGQYASNDIDNFQIVGVDIAGGGSINTSALMINGFFEFDWQDRWHPYVGGGIGFAEINVDNATVLGVFLADDSDTVFAYQAGGGIGYSLSDSLILSLDYRYFATADPDFTAVGGVPFEAEYGRHDVRLTLRWML